MFRMHTAHLANVSKSVTKNATFPRTGRLPCLITRQLHVSQLLGDSFSVSQRPPIRDACSHSSMPIRFFVSWCLGFWVLVSWCLGVWVSWCLGVWGVSGCLGVWRCHVCFWLSVWTDCVWRRMPTKHVFFPPVEQWPFIALMEWVRPGAQSAKSIKSENLGCSQG